MDARLKQAMADRETELMWKVRPGFIRSVEAWFKKLNPPDLTTVGVVAKQLIDTGALYGKQAKMSRDEFLAYAAEAWDLYSFFVKAAGGDVDKAHELARQAKG
jgi:hypothetical protein